jgi:hypothetical protein
MSNYPAGAQYDSAAPWNQPTRRTEWRAWYVFVAGTDEDNHTLQHEVYFPSYCDRYEVIRLAKAYCSGEKLDYVDLEEEEDRHFETIETEVYFE